MCIGVPMRVIESHPYYAICDDDQGQSQRVDTALLGQQAVGAWLLVFLGNAREVLDADSATALRNALQALTAVAAGETNVDHLFADLVGREPPLPDHLKPLPKR